MREGVVKYGEILLPGSMYVEGSVLTRLSMGGGAYVSG